MRVLVSGAGGFIGSALGEALVRHGHEPIRLERGEPESGARTWSIAERRIDPGALEEIDAVVHLSGRPITPPFTAGKKREIMESRRVGTAIIAEAVAEHRPAVFVCASAIGYYGDRGDEVLTEASSRGEGFLAEVAAEWEAACQPAREAGVRMVNIRSALVLDGGGGLLPLVALPFRLFLGGPLGDGRQWWSWITLEDEARAIVHLLEDEIEGPVNLAAPNPVRNREFTQTLARVLHRPAWIPVPAWVMRLVMGEAADELVLASQRVAPERLVASGFEFRHPTLSEALESAFR